MFRTWGESQVSKVLGTLGIHMAYAIASSGHLPLMMPLLLFGSFAEGLMARVAWTEGRFKA